jgi:hypothetical protein
MTVARPMSERRGTWCIVAGMYAYLDAGTGSMLMAAFAGGAAGIGVLLRLYGHRFLGVFSKKHRQAAEETFGDLMGSSTADD